jgi:NAD(P)-dependent dehydrogenase (short-subunit alcohol dehydrogenase family)
MNIQRGGTMTSVTTPVSGQREPELAGQTVVVIGGSSGIGLETARRARTEAADVIIAGRNPDRLKKAAAEAAAEAGGDVTGEIGEGLPHVYSAPARHPRGRRGHQPDREVPASPVR